jgi:para-nitrobenzyl esterase
MSNNRRDFLKTFGTGAATLGLGGMTFSSCSSTSGDSVSSPEQVLEVSQNGAIVETRSGKVRGYRRNGIFTYKGIPYGGPTSGKNRFMAPTSPEPWAGIRNALDWGPSAPQPKTMGVYLNTPVKPDMSPFSRGFTYHGNDNSYGEDCLFINVWTPDINDTSKRPVLVWLHGGGFLGGSSGALDAYIGENLSKSGDVVVCSINHRLNAFGYINLGAIAGERFKDSANAGMLDIIASLKWVNENISDFGGDPANVTIFGQSGGGAKVSILMAMPEAKGLFHKAMTISGATLTTGDYDQQAELAELVLKEAGLKASRIGELQELPWMDFYQIAMKSKAIFNKSANDASRRFIPCMDQLHIPRHPFDPDAPSISSGIPMIIGNCTSELSPSANDPKVEDISIEGVKEKLRNGMSSYGKALGKHAGEIVDAYVRCFPGKKPVEIWGFISWDIRSRALLQAERQTANGGAVYNYLFDWKTPLYDGQPRAYHNSDLAFWFNNTDVMDTITGGGERPRRLSEKMSQALIHFARNGDPNHSGIPAWPTYDSKNGAVMIWNDDCEIQYDPDREARNTLHELLGE